MNTCRLFGHTVLASLIAAAMLSFWRRSSR
jgi:hypothetical protein